jgi:hypothetical protein
MKLKFYVDIYPGLDYHRAVLYATTQPCQKGGGVRRFAFEVELDDTIINDVDVEVSPAKVGAPLLQP